MYWFNPGSDGWIPISHEFLQIPASTHQSLKIQIQKLWDYSTSFPQIQLNPETLGLFMIIPNHSLNKKWTHKEIHFFWPSSR